MTSPPPGSFTRSGDASRSRAASRRAAFFSISASLRYRMSARCTDNSRLVCCMHGAPLEIRTERALTCIHIPVLSSPVISPCLVVTLSPAWRSCYLLRHSMQLTGWTSRFTPARGLGQQLVQGILLVCSPGLPVCCLGLPPHAKRVPVVLHCSCHAQLAPACPFRAACNAIGHTDVACERPVGEHTQQQNRDAQTSAKLSCSCMRVMCMHCGSKPVQQPVEPLLHVNQTRKASGQQPFGLWPGLQERSKASGALTPDAPGVFGAAQGRVCDPHVIPCGQCTRVPGACKLREQRVRLFRGELVEEVPPLQAQPLAELHRPT